MYNFVVVRCSESSGADGRGITPKLSFTLNFKIVSSWPAVSINYTNNELHYTV